VALVVQGDARAVRDTSTMRASLDGVAGRYAFDGVMQDALGTTTWLYGGLWKNYMRFSAVTVLPPVWVAGQGSGSGSGLHATTGPSVRQVSSTDWGTEVDSVDAPAALTVVRSEAYLAGWSASITPAGGGASRPLTVSPHGLIQSVRVPAGRWTLTFVYRAPHLSAGLAASGAALAGFVALGVVVVVRSRHGRRRGGVGSVAR
jgi:hypothetical protein